MILTGGLPHEQRIKSNFYQVEPLSSQLSINSGSGEVTLNGVPAVSQYDFTVEATNGDQTAVKEISIAVSQGFIRTNINNPRVAS